MRTAIREASTAACRECGAEGYEVGYRPETRRELLDLGVCLSCWHWLGVVEQRSAHVVVEGFAFRPKPDMPEARALTGGWGLGAGGVVQHFVLADGTLLRCNNVWNRGPVPEAFKGRLPDDARRATAEDLEALDWSRALTHLPRDGVAVADR